MSIPTEPIGSIPRPQFLIEAVQDSRSGRLAKNILDELYTQAVQDTIRRFEATGSPVITDGEQTKPSFVTYAIHGLEPLANDGLVIAFADGHTRQLSRLTFGPFRYRTHADHYLKSALPLTNVPLKQAVIFCVGA
jgi:5-methyltetrahydropteroyltriglutamate--homocysteine methyltransferase